MRSRILPLLFPLVAASTVAAQGFQQQYGGPLHQEGVAVLPDADGITVVVRNTTRPDGPIAMRLLRTDAQGAEQTWTDLPMDGSAFVQDAVDGPGGTIVLCGSVIRPGGSHHDAFIRSVAANGATNWTWMTDTPSEDEQLFSLERTADDGFVGCGAWRGATDSDAFAAKVDAAGAPAWSSHFGTELDEWTRGITASPDGYVAVGRAVTYHALNDTTFYQDNEAYLLGLDANGTEQWWQSWGGPKDDELYSVVRAGNTLIAAGYTDSFGDTTYLGKRFRNVYLIAVAPDGDTTWTRTLGDTLQIHAAQAITRASNGELLVGGYRERTRRTDDLVMRVTDAGDLLWTKYYDLADEEELQRLVPAADGGFFGTGRCYGHLAGQVLLLRKNAGGD